MKLLIVDDHAMVRAGLAALLRQPRYDVQVLQARNASEGIDMIRANSDIDVVLLDVSMPGMNGFEAVREFGRARPDLPIILLTASEDPADVRRGLAAGALGYVPKSSSPDTLMSAIRLVLSGEIYVPTVMLRGDDVETAGTKATAGAPLPLTKRQTEVLQMLDRGLSNKAIGRELELSERTVKAHITAIFKSLRVTNRSEAVEFARRAALI
jgi:two-component system nitrate/nitrite response regulator NarL